MTNVNKVYLVFAIFNAFLFGRALGLDRVGPAIFGGFVTLFCSLGAAAKWKD